MQENRILSCQKQREREVGVGSLHLFRLDLPHPITTPHEAHEDAIPHEIVHLLYALVHLALVVLTPFLPRPRDLLALILSELAIVKIRILDPRKKHALYVHQQIVEGHADAVIGPDFDEPWQARVKELHVWRRRLRGKAREVVARDLPLQFAEQDPRKVLPQVPHDRRLP